MSRKRPAGGAGGAPGATTIAPVTLLRREDLLALKFSFVNLKIIELGGAKFLTPAAGTQPAFLLVEFPPQSFAEEAVVEQPGARWRPTSCPRTTVS